MGMDIGCRESSSKFHKCYKIGSLNQAILDTVHVADLKDRYVLGEQLGWGQFGVIRSCSDRFTGERLACKSISKDRLVTLDDLQSVKLEIEIMTKLSGHPNVVNLEAVYEEEDYVHLVMELCAGGELFHRLEKNGKFSELEARVIFQHLMQVVKFCHDNGIVHRDLKPENILLATTALSSPIKLADFGLATHIKSGERLHGTVGSPFYIAPEVLAGGYNEAADVWSAGVILYILLSGMPPFWGKTKSKIFDAVRVADLRFPPDHWNCVSASAKDLIAGMLCVDSSKRLTAKETLAHRWMENFHEIVQEPYQPNFDCMQLEIGGGSFSIPYMGKNQNPSYNEDHIKQSPVFTCKSSFSSFLTGDQTAGGFSFTSSDVSSRADFSSSVPSVPSFTFSRLCSTTEHATTGARISKTEEKLEDPDLEKLVLLLDSSLGIKCVLGETEQQGSKRRNGIRSRRNHTIGLGELVQLDVSSSESVIRWVSCTRIPTTPSLRLSLVW